MNNPENAYSRLNNTDILNREEEIKKGIKTVNKANLKTKKSGGRTIQSVDRAMDLLEALAGQPGECGLNEISAKTGINASTCHHLLNTLMRRGYISQDPRTRMYFLGNKILDLSQAKSQQTDFTKTAKPILLSLTGETGETSLLAKIQGRELTILDSVNSSKMVRIDGDVAGRSNAAHATATGKAILAWLPEGEIAAIIAEKGLTQFTENTTTGLADLLNELALVRRHGYAIDEEEFQTDVVCIAAAIRAHSGTVIASIGCTLPKVRATEENLKKIKELVKTAANTLSKELGSSL